MKLKLDELEPKVTVISEESCILQTDATFFASDDENAILAFKYPAKVIRIRGTFWLDSVVDVICDTYPHVLAIVVICKTLVDMNSLKNHEELKNLHLLYFALESEVKWVK